MSIFFKCRCGRQYRVNDDLAGKRAKCQACGQTRTVPEPHSANTSRHAPQSIAPLGAVEHDGRKNHDNILTVSAVVVGAIFGAALWIVLPALTGKKEAWDSFWLYSLSMVFGGFVLALMCRHRLFWLPVLSLYVGQVVFVLAVLNSPWFNAVVFVGLVGVPPALGGAAIASALLGAPSRPISLLLISLILLLGGQLPLLLALIVALVAKHLLEKRRQTSKMAHPGPRQVKHKASQQGVQTEQAKPSRTTQMGKPERRTVARIQQSRPQVDDAHVHDTTQEQPLTHSEFGVASCLVGIVMLLFQLTIGSQHTMYGFMIPFYIYLIGVPSGLALALIGFRQQRRKRFFAISGVCLTLAGPLVFVLNTYGRMPPRLGTKVFWFENTNGAGSFGPQQVIIASTRQEYRPHPADVDGDKDVDLLSVRGDKISWHENTDGAGTLGPQRVIATTAPFTQP